MTRRRTRFTLAVLGAALLALVALTRWSPLGEPSQRFSANTTSSTTTEALLEPPSTSPSIFEGLEAVEVQPELPRVAEHQAPIVAADHADGRLRVAFELPGCHGVRNVEVRLVDGNLEVTVWVVPVDVDTAHLAECSEWRTVYTVADIAALPQVPVTYQPS